MKLRFSDRICGAIAGLALIFAAVTAVLRSVFDIHLLRIISDFVATYIERGTLLWKICICVAAVILLIVGEHCLSMLFRRNSKKNSFVTQKTDAGEMSISIHAIERLVEQCVERYPDTKVESIKLENLKDSLIIKMKVTMDSGINIPVTVGNLQRQVKQYVTDCSGVDVREVRVQVEPSAAKRNAPNNAPAAPVVERPEIKPVAEDDKPEEKIPLHQRIFGREETKAEKEPEARIAEAAVEQPVETAAEQAVEAVTDASETAAEAIEEEVEENA